MKKQTMQSKIQGVIDYLYDTIRPINDSKIFAGLIILTLNISSKMMTLPTSRTVEAVIKNTLSHYVLVFAISWMGTRDIVVAVFITCTFAFLMEFVLNEKSMFCCLPDNFVQKHIRILEEFEGNPEKVSSEELAAALKTIEKAQRVLLSK